jgi:hypothetical protein
MGPRRMDVQYMRYSPPRVRVRDRGQIGALAGKLKPLGQLIDVICAGTNLLRWLVSHPRPLQQATNPGFAA